MKIEARDAIFVKLETVVPIDIERMELRSQKEGIRPQLYGTGKSLTLADSNR